MRRVLVAESQDDSRQTACDMLSLLGHASSGAASLAEAEQALATAHFDMLLGADDVADDGQARRLVLVGHAGGAVIGDDGAVVISKPYSMEKLRTAMAGMVTL